MRMYIWKKDDYLGHPDRRGQIDIKGIEHEDEVPLCYGYRHNKPPIGRVFDIQTTDLNEMTCEVEFFVGEKYENATFLKTLILNDEGYLEEPSSGIRFRLGIYVYKSKFDNPEDRALCTGGEMPMVALLMETEWPYCETSANRGGFPNVGAVTNLEDIGKE